MIRIAHRINTSAQLRNVPTDLGVEIDLRSRGKDLILHHDPYTDGELFLEWLESYRHKTIILNVKEEGLEEALLRIMRQQKIDDFFFLDQSFPFLIKTARAGVRRCAVRVSEFESIETAISLAGLVDWVWVDCFTRFPLTRSDATRLKGAGFKLCLVSPELQGRTDPDHVRDFRANVAAAGVEGDAVCTKLPEVWS
jgi:hypothetical protein